MQTNTNSISKNDLNNLHHIEQILNEHNWIFRSNLQ